MIFENVNIKKLRVLEFFVIMNDFVYIYVCWCFYDNMFDLINNDYLIDFLDCEILEEEEY